MIKLHVSIVFYFTIIYTLAGLFDSCSSRRDSPVTELNRREGEKVFRKIFPTGMRDAAGEMLWDVEGEVRPESWLRARRILSPIDQTSTEDVQRACFAVKADAFKRRQETSSSPPPPVVLHKKATLRLVYSS